MRRLAFAAVSAVAVLAGSISAAVAQPDDPYDYPYCLKEETGAIRAFAAFRVTNNAWSYEQCMATASGTKSYCGINPRWAFARQRRGY